MKRITSELSRRIPNMIDELHSDDSLGHWPTRVCNQELINALPLHGNSIYLWVQVTGASPC